MVILTFYSCSMLKEEKKCIFQQLKDVFPVDAKH